MAGTGKVPRKGPKPEAEEEPVPEPEAEAEGRQEEAEAPAGPSRPLRTLPPGQKEAIPAIGWGVLAVAVVMFAVAGVMFLLPLEAGPPEVWMVTGAVLAIGGFAALAYFFDKWGKL